MTTYNGITLRADSGPYIVTALADDARSFFFRLS